MSVNPKLGSWLGLGLQMTVLGGGAGVKGDLWTCPALASTTARVVYVPWVPSSAVARAPPDQGGLGLADQS